MRDYTKATGDLSELKPEVLKAIRGERKFSPELLNDLILQAEKTLGDVEVVRNAAKMEFDECKYCAEEMQTQYNEVIS